MKFKQMLKDELKGKGGIIVALEAAALVAILIAGYFAFLAIGALYVSGN